MLKKSQGKYLFKSRELLQEVIWVYMEALLNIGRVHQGIVHSNKDMSELVGVTKKGNLVILQIKNGGGKKGIDALVRYWKYFKKNREEEEDYIDEYNRVDMEKEFQTIAIASNFTDDAKAQAERKLPNCLLLTYEIEKDSDGNYFMSLINPDNTVYSKVEIEIVEDKLFSLLPAFLQGYLLERKDLRQRVLKMIFTILSYSEDMEFAMGPSHDDKSIVFGKYDEEGYLVRNKECLSIKLYPFASCEGEGLELSVELPITDSSYANKRKNENQIHRIETIYVETYSDAFDKVFELEDWNFGMNRYEGPVKYPVRNDEIDEVYDNFIDYYINYRRTDPARKKLRPLKRSDFETVEGMVRMALEDWSVR